MRTKPLVFSTGLAMFSMFFGSGNLVFPLLVGQLSQGHFGLASLGIFLTGVLVPFLGILALFLFKGDSNEFFGRLGKPATFWFPLIALSLMGPFGVLARCITVAHGAFKMLLPSTPLWLFSLCLCCAIFLLTIKKNRIVPLLGTILTPLLLVSLAAISLFGIISMDLPTVEPNGGWDSFKEGIFQGYQTMDLLAAFFFSSFVIQHLKNHRISQENPSASLPIFFKASLVGAFLLAGVYFLLVVLGSMYAPEIASIPPQEVLGFIAQRALGSWAGPVVCLAVALACLTTAIVLTSLFSDFLRKEVTKGKINLPVSLITTLVIAFSISTLEFSGIAKFIGPILEISYPALITLTVVSIFYKLWGWKTVRMPFAVAIIVKFITGAI